MKNVSFTEDELMKSKEKEEKYTVKKIIGHKTEKRIKYYQVWWKNYLKKNSTWEPEKKLITDGLKDMIDEYNKN